MLEIEGLDAAYGDATALWSVSLTVGERELVSVVGPNGSGKTTLINTIAGLLPPRRGRLRFDGEDLARTGAARGIRARNRDRARGRRLFGRMTVEENLELGCSRRGAGLPRAAPRARTRCSLALGDRRVGRRPERSEASSRWSRSGERADGRPAPPAASTEPSLGLAPAIVDLVFEMVEASTRLAPRCCSSSRT